MGVIQEAFFSESSYEDAMKDTKWMAAFVAFNIMTIGLVRSIFSWQMGVVPLIISAIFLILAFIPVYILRVGIFVVFTLLLWADFFMRFNPFSIVYSLIGVYHVYLLIRWRPERKKETPAS